MKHVLSMKKIDNFMGDYRWLSNFEMAPVEFEGIFYPSSEHAYQAAKTADVKLRLKIRNTEKPKDAKRMGNELELRPNWDNIKYDIMYKIVKDKFMRNSKLKDKLIATGTAELIEGNTWNDVTWGVCNGKGKNWLGKILMRVRNEIG